MNNGPHIENGPPDHICETGADYEPMIHWLPLVTAVGIVAGLVTLGWRLAFT